MEANPIDILAKVSHNSRRAQLYRTLTMAMTAADDLEYDAYVQYVGSASAPVHPPTLRCCPPDIEILTERMGRAKRVIVLEPDLLQHTTNKEDGLGHADITNYSECAYSAVLYTRNCTVDELNDVALKQKQLQEQASPDDNEQKILTLEGSSNVMGYDGVDAIGDETVSAEFLKMCQHSGTPPHELHLSRDVLP